jgi:sugar O-acyltransferase (sialic acid O-acetyltransferase NeuD family)
MPENRKILLLGAGGHCKSVLDSLLALSYYETVGLIEKQERGPSNNDGKNRSSENFMGVSVVGTDDDLQRLFLEGYTDAFITVGSIGDVSLRKKLYSKIKQIGFLIPNIIDPSSVISPYSSMGEGVYVGKNAVINADTEIGNCAIINTASILEHECKIGDFVHIAPGSILSGGVWVDEGTHIGTGSVVKQGVRIGAYTMIGMGSIVLNDIRSRVTAYGNPCKEVENE